MKKSLLLNCDNFLTYYYLGILQKFKEEDRIKDIKNYVGVSLGSLLCLFLILEINIEKIFQNEHLKFEKINSFYFTSRNINEIDEKYHEKFKTLIEEIILQKLDKIPTLSELYLMTKKDFNIGVYNKNKLQLEYLSHFTNPSMSVLDAIFYSCDISQDNDEYYYFINPSFLNIKILLNEFNTINHDFICITFNERNFIDSEILNHKHIINYENQKIFERENTEIIYVNFSNNTKIIKEILYENGLNHIKENQHEEECVNIFLK